MTILLHRFPLSHFSEKGRALLAFKKLDYRIVDHKLGLPQLGLYRLSGQRKVPVIEDDGKVVADSTAIGLYLEERYPDPRFLPDDPARRREVLALEDRVDRVLGMPGPVVWFDFIVRERPEQLRRFFELEAWGAGQGRVLAAMTRGAWRAPKVRRIVARSQEKTRAFLLDLCERLEQHPYLLGNEPTFADVAAASLAFHLEFPSTRYLVAEELAGVGVPGWADAPEFARFFQWRRDFYARFLI